MSDWILYKEFTNAERLKIESVDAISRIEAKCYVNAENGKRILITENGQIYDIDSHQSIGIPRNSADENIRLRNTERDLENES